MIGAGAVSILAAILVGCASAPATRYYTLMPPPAASKSAAATAHIDWELLPVAVPAQVDQPQWVVRTPDGRLAVLEQERWIAPLGEEIRDAVTENLTRAFGPPRTASSAQGAAPWRVRIEVRRFDLLPDREARLAADWSVRGEGVDATCHFDLSSPVSGLDYLGLARAQQEAMSQLAGAIGAALGKAGKGQAIAC